MKPQQTDLLNGTCPIEIAEKDIFEAMKTVDGYLDITPADFKTVYGVAYRQAFNRLLNKTTGRDIMTSPAIAVPADMALLQVAKKMAKHGISGMPVIDYQRHVTGVVSEKDFLYHMGDPGAKSFMQIVSKCLTGDGCMAVPIRRRKAADIMSSPAITITAKTPLAKIAGLLTAQKINRLPVVDQAGKLTGIITRSDIVAASGAIDPSAQK
jgi:CBS domain-containing membrane protein